MQLADHIRKARQIQNKFSHPSCAAVIVAAGSSARMGGTDKILAELGGLPVLSRTLRVFDDHDMRIFKRFRRTVLSFLPE